MPRSAPLLLALLGALLALAAPATAGAADGFLGVLADGRAVRFASDGPTGLSSPRRIAGVQGGDRIVALAPGHALGRSGRLYAFDAAALRARPTGVRVELRGRSFSLLVDQAGQRARILADDGFDAVVDLASETVAPGPGLRAQDGAPVRPAAALLPDGRITGVDAARRTVVTETAPGSNVVTETALTNRREQPLGLRAPNTFAVASGTGFLVSGFPRRLRTPQSRLLRTDLATGATSGEAGPFFFRELAAVMATGPVADDRTAPRVRFRGIGRRVSLRALSRRGGYRLRLRCSEGCNVVASSAVGGRNNLAASRSTDVARTFTVRLPRLAGRELRLMRLRLGRTAFFRVRVQDWAGNDRLVERRFRLVR